ncbi:MAG: hypothetical protein IT462_09585 [Planctomycetes bacterium]|nr:hypothetical protein [Planctomycetota bacterium]
MKLSFFAAAVLCAALAPALCAEEAREVRRAASPPAPKAEESAKKVAWEKEIDKAVARANKEDKRILALFFMAGGG